MGKKKFVDPDTQYFRYLGRLRSNGRSNMYGAIPYLAADFRVSREEAFRVVCRWVDQRAESGEAPGEPVRRAPRVELPAPPARFVPRAEQIAFQLAESAPAASAARPVKRRRAARTVPKPVAAVAPVAGTKRVPPKAAAPKRATPKPAMPKRGAPKAAPSAPAVSKRAAPKAVAPKRAAPAKAPAGKPAPKERRERKATPVASRSKRAA